MSNIKLSKSEMAKIIQLTGLLGAFLDKLVVPLMKVAVLLAKNVLALLATVTFSSAIFKEKIMEKML